MATSTPPASAPTPPAPAHMSRARRYTVRTLLAIGTLVAITAIFSVFANRQALNADNWADTSSAMLENTEIRTQVADYLVDQVYADVDVSAELAAALPDRLKPLAGPVSGGLRNLADRSTNVVLGRPRVQLAWKEANRLTAEQFIAIADDKSRVISASGGAVILDLRVLVLDLATRLGLPGRVLSKIPPDAGRIKIMSSNQVSVVQDVASALRGLAVVLPALALALLGLAVFVARGRRHETLFFVGIDLIAAGVVVLIARGLIGDRVVASLASTDAIRPASDAAWSIGTRMLRDVSEATIIVGIPVVVAGWLAGERTAAVSLRRAMAPTLRDRPALAYGVLAALLLLVIAWGPIPATRMVIPVLIMIALAVAGLAALRRQTAAEFAGVPAHERGAIHDGLARGLRAVQGRNSHGVPSHTGNGDAKTAAAPPDPGGRLGRLERLSSLHDTGALTDEEFASAKADVLTGRTAT